VCGELRVDAAFVAAPTEDVCGNINGVDGRAACGTLGYPIADVRHASRVVAVTDNLVPFPSCPIQIAQDWVDHVVSVESIGDPGQIASGTTLPTTHLACGSRRQRQASSRRPGCSPTASPSRPARAACP
jgi:citrate lyase subunit alpha / citrate CoA-transferase